VFSLLFDFEFFKSNTIHNFCLIRERERKDLRLLFSLVQEERSKRFQVERLDDRR
jgi:hypothetical protein